ncbi:MAG: DNA polymerase III subunit delta [Bacilli bacterium]|nr:DNA polymerase III subunit delta [Bacilli bacterium]MDD4608197.1 DNA polymerase III subunit delta [Bacilli bacterium]
MLYLFYGKENFLIDKEIKKVLLDNNIDQINTNTYDLEVTLLKDVIDDAVTISLFSDKKAIICNNSHLFTGSKKTILDDNIDTLDEYLDHPNPDTILIFTVNADNIDDRKKIVKKMKKVGGVKDFNSNKNINNLVIQMFEDYKVGNNTINLLIDRVGTDLNLLDKEVDKIKLYKLEEKEVTDNDVILLTNKNIDMDIFKLIDNIVLKNKERALETYYELLKYNEDPLSILIRLSNQFRVMYQSKELYQRGYTQKNISEILEAHPYYIQKVLEKGTIYDNKEILKYINDLADLDFKIKSSGIDKEIAMELFIINI